MQESVTRTYDMNWSVEFDITLDGTQVSYFDLDELTQEYLCNQIRDGSMSGTTGGAKMWRAK